MNNSDVVSALANNWDMTQKETRQLLDAIINTFKDNLAQGVSFTIPQLGTFDSHTRARRKSYNPGEEKFMMLPPKRVVDFRPNEGLKEEMKDIDIE